MTPGAHRGSGGMGRRRRVLGLSYERRGKGEPLLLIHGAGSYRRVWEPIMDALARERDVIAVDLPGHGDSPPMEEGEPPTPQNFARLMVAFLEDLGVGSAHVAGNSSGGWTALEMALLGRARSVTALSPAGLWRNGTPRQVVWVFRFGPTLARRLGRLTPILVSRSAGRALVLSLFFGRPWKMPEDAAADAACNFARSPGLWPHVKATSTERFSGGQHFGVPVTVAWGTRDLLLLPGQARLRVELPSQTRWVALPGCGHVPTYDDSKLVARVILEGSSEDADEGVDDRRRQVQEPRGGQGVRGPFTGETVPEARRGKENGPGRNLTL